MPDCARGVLEIFVEKASNLVVELVCLVGVLEFVDPETKSVKFDEDSIVHFSLGQLDIADAICFEVQGGVVQCRGQGFLLFVAPDGSFKAEFQRKGGYGIEAGIVHCRA